MPSAKAYPLDKLMAAVDRYQIQTRQKVNSGVQNDQTGAVAFAPCMSSQNLSVLYVLASLTVRQIIAANALCTCILGSCCNVDVLHQS